MRLTDLDKRALDQHGLITLTQSGLSRAGWYRAQSDRCSSRA